MSPPDAPVLSGVSKTSILTLRARADEHRRSDRIFADPLAAEWSDRVGWPPELDRWYDAGAQAALAFRADDLDEFVRRFAAEAPLAAVVELGAGLSTRYHRLADLAIPRWVDLDLPEVVALRARLGAAHEHLARSVLDLAWLDALDGAAGPILFVAEGLFYYLPLAEVRGLIAELGRRFPGSALAMDVLGRTDHSKLLENTQAVGTPIAWHYEGDYADVLSAFGLGEIEGLEPERLTLEMIQRYWHRFDDKTRGLLYWAKTTPWAWARRSGNVIGRLGPG